MQKLISKAGLFFCLLAVTAVVSCSKDDDNNKPPSNTISDVVAADADLSTLESALIKANLTATLSGTGPFTLFAPTNEGFTNAGITSDVLNSISTTDLSNLLLYHVIPSLIPAAGVPAGPNAKVIAANGDSVFVTSNANGVFINGVKVIQADITASNGIIHKTGNVLMPAIGNIVETAQADTSFSYLVAAVLRASTGSVDIAGILSGNDILTVFAPTNNAFRALGFPTIDAINAANPDVLAGILAYHVIEGRIFSSDLSNGIMPATLAGGATVTIGVSASGASVKGTSNTTASNITKANIVATNGVIHVIDQVLLP
jgi:uncharacterized surface protein with fasciclin (FAS1) repeats